MALKLRFLLVIICLGLSLACAINPNVWKSPESYYITKGVLPSQKTAVVEVVCIETKEDLDFPNIFQRLVKKVGRKYKIRIGFSLTQDRSEAVGPGIILFIESNKN